MGPGASPAPATFSLAVMSTFSLSVVCWSSPQRGERSCLVLKPLTLGQTWCWSSSLSRWFSQPQGRRRCPPPGGTLWVSAHPALWHLPCVPRKEGWWWQGDTGRTDMLATWTHTLGVFSFCLSKGGQSSVRASVRLWRKRPHPCQVWRKIRKMLETAAATKYS